MKPRFLKAIVVGLPSVLLLAGCAESAADALRRQQAQQPQFQESQRQLDDLSRSLEESNRISQEMDRILRDQQAVQEYFQREAAIEPATAAQPAAVPAAVQ